jgi:hypothetical protein
MDASLYLTKRNTFTARKRYKLFSDCLWIDVDVYSATKYFEKLAY